MFSEHDCWLLSFEFDNEILFVDFKVLPLVLLIPCKLFSKYVDKIEAELLLYSVIY